MVYFDHHAATPLCDAARDAMASAEGAWANPSSVHAAGRAARALLERSRDQVAASVGAMPAEVVFTSGGTEACNLALLGLPAKRVIASTIEHPAISSTLDRLALRGVPVLRVPMERVLSAEIDVDTLVVAQWVNHETGDIAAIEGIAEVVVRRGAKLVVDATQAFGKVNIDLLTVPATALTLASHKIGGPSGTGALVLRRGVELDPQIVGGSQERGRRAGSPDVRGAVGFGAACLTIPERLSEMPRLASLRDEVERELVRLGGVVNGIGPRVATVTNVSFPALRGEALVAALDLEGVCASTGAACSSGLAEPSPVLLAMHPGEPWRASSALRLSFGIETNDRDIVELLRVLRAILGRMRPGLDVS